MRQKRGQPTSLDCEKKRGTHLERARGFQRLPAIQTRKPRRRLRRVLGRSLRHEPPGQGASHRPRLRPRPNTRAGLRPLRSHWTLWEDRCLQAPRASPQAPLQEPARLGKRPSSSTRRWRRPWHTTPRAQPPLSCLASPSRASGLRRSKEVPHPGVLALRQRGLPEQLRRADRAGEAQAARALFHRFFRGRRLFLLLRRVGQEFKSSVLAKAALRVVGERIRETRDQAVKRVAPQLKMAAARQPRPKLDSSVLFSCSQGKKLSQAPRGRPSRRRVGPRRPGEGAKQSLEPREPLPSGARIVLGARAAGFLADRRESGEPLHWPLGRKKPVLSLAFLGPAPQDRRQLDEVNGLVYQKLASKFRAYSSWPAKRLAVRDPLRFRFVCADPSAPRAARTCWRTFAARAPAAPRPGPRCGISTPRLRLSRSAWSSAAI